MAHVGLFVRRRLRGGDRRSRRGTIPPAGSRPGAIGSSTAGISVCCLRAPGPSAGGVVGTPRCLFSLESPYCNGGRRLPGRARAGRALGLCWEEGPVGSLSRQDDLSCFPCKRGETESGKADVEVVVVSFRLSLAGGPVYARLCFGGLCRELLIATERFVGCFVSSSCAPLCGGGCRRLCLTHSGS